MFNPNSKTDRVLVILFERAKREKLELAPWQESMLEEAKKQGFNAASFLTEKNAEAVEGEI